MTTPPTPDPDRWMSPATYAKACGVSHQAITNRLQRETLRVETQILLDGSKAYFIDSHRYPPEKRTAGTTKGKKSNN